MGEGYSDSAILYSLAVGLTLGLATWFEWSTVMQVRILAD